MKRAISKPPRVSICSSCRGTGKMVDYIHDAQMTCPQCCGSGRVVVSCEMVVDVRPYKEGETL